jgi:5'-3' exonuclease
MGVKGLWSLVSHTGKPIRLEALSSEVLAIDASIWLHQFLKALRTPQGQLIPGAHVVGFFRRICKLLFYGIKPVFVYDGKPPELKRRTMVVSKRWF